MYVRTRTILDEILEDKVAHLPALHQRLADVHQALASAPPVRDFAGALRREHVALIAEVKKASPSKGLLAPDFDAVGLAQIYATNGAAACSVLTDERFFQGALAHLQAVRAAVDVPLLRKDFIIDAAQIEEARAVGADAVLLIVMALGDGQLRELAAAAAALGMAALVEVHSEDEAERALLAGASLIGVNNRDLRTFREDLGTTDRVARLLPPGVTLVAESAIRTPEDVRAMGALGAHAVLVGEGLVTAPDRAAQVRAFSSQRREERA